VPGKGPTEQSVTGNDMALGVWGGSLCSAVGKKCLVTVSKGGAGGKIKIGEWGRTHTKNAKGWVNLPFGTGSV